MTNNEEYIYLIKDWIRPLQKALTLESENRFTNLLNCGFIVLSKKIFFVFLG